jgi:hypothetical protein
MSVTGLAFTHSTGLRNRIVRFSAIGAADEVDHWDEAMAKKRIMGGTRDQGEKAVH